ncbi:PaaI family thioesterase [Phytoactinopolyspora mesophila]|uniref:Hotdog fold thioesterase n=1 Tax=Phytoactinopolyspora mesophila TaxID=2650750 RepID=A0A7K3LWU5_9ACTN|nr:hotdog fold thioesterase [Phytoactinopolyspora mesophila]NDL55489.1 hotdog fold thioesterase [Phytoactinopolyspora mesophila]
MNQIEPGKTSTKVNPEDIPASALDQRMGITFVELSPDRVVGRMPVEGNTQPFGLLHGGASCVLAETLGSTAAALHSRPGRVPLGVEINATHHRAAREGHVTGVATPIHRGKTFATFDVVITDDDNRRVCTARITCFLREMPPEPS